MLHSAINRAHRNVVSERRVTDRYPVHIQAIMIDGLQMGEPVTIINISTQGLLAVGKGKFIIGAPVAFDLSEFGRLEAEIRWAGNGLIGCAFRDPIDDLLFTEFRKFQQDVSLT